MADLTFIEKKKFETLLQMSGGYVLDFTDRTMHGFVSDSIKKNFYAESYLAGSGSKANRMRRLWEVESNHVVGKLLADLLAYWKTFQCRPDEESLFRECELIAERLRKASPVDALDAISAEGPEREFELLATAVRDSINANKPEAGLDRLHTFVVKLIRGYAERRGVVVEQNKSMPALFGEYVRVLHQTGLIESEMTAQIIKAAAKIMDAFNTVRNNQSLAHDNPALNSEEALLFFNHVCSTVRFIKALEAADAAKRAATAAASVRQQAADDIPF